MDFDVLHKMKSLVIFLSLLLLPLAGASEKKNPTVLEQFLSEKPPYSIETSKRAYLALCDIGRQRGFARLGFALGSARLWEEKVLKVSEDGTVDKALKEAGYKNTKIYDLIYLGRGWTTDFKSTDKDAKTQEVFRKLTQKKQAGEQDTVPNP